jgi:hypothetical protein
MRAARMIRVLMIIVFFISLTGCEENSVSVVSAMQGLEPEKLSFSNHKI